MLKRNLASCILAFVATEFVLLANTGKIIAQVISRVLVETEGTASVSASRAGELSAAINTQRLLGHGQFFQIASHQAQVEETNS
jgi:hypothetical protein